MGRNNSAFYNHPANMVSVQKPGCSASLFLYVVLLQYRECYRTYIRHQAPTDADMDTPGRLDCSTNTHDAVAVYLRIINSSPKYRLGLFVILKT